MKTINSLIATIVLMLTFSMSLYAQEPLTEVVGISQDGNVIKNNTGAPYYGWLTSGFATSNSINGDGHIEWRSGPNNKHLIIGLSSSKDRNHHYDVDFGIMNNLEGEIVVLESGGNKYNVDTYVEGDHFAVKRTGSTITYLKNGTTFYTSTKSSSGKLIGDGAIFHSGAYITDLKLVDAENENNSNAIGMTYFLYDKDNGNKKYQLSQGITFDTNIIGDNISIEAVPDGTVGSIYMTMSGTTTYSSTENIKPYFFFKGDTGSIRTPTGEVTIKARVYSIRNGETNGGVPIREDSFTINFVDATTDTTDRQDPSSPVLSLKAKTETTIDLDWTEAIDNIGVTGYELFRDGETETELGSNARSYKFPSLTANTTYVFTIEAIDAARNRSYSNTLSVTTDSSEDSSDDGDTSGGDTSGGDTSGGSTVWKESSGNISYSDGNVGIGTNAIANYKLAVDGKIRSREVKVDNDNWADYVFFKDYKLPTLQEVEKHIKEKGHLINIPSAAEVEANGIELGEMNKLLLEKIEELTLYVIEQEKEIQNLKKVMVIEKP